MKSVRRGPLRPGIRRNADLEQLLLELRGSYRLGNDDAHFDLLASLRYTRT